MVVIFMQYFFGQIIVHTFSVYLFEPAQKVYMILRKSDDPSFFPKFLGTCRNKFPFVWLISGRSWPGADWIKDRAMGRQPKVLQGQYLDLLPSFGDTQGHLAFKIAGSVNNIRSQTLLYHICNTGPVQVL